MVTIKKMRVSFVVLTVFTITIFSACEYRFTENELIGSYSPVNYQNSYDTIHLYANGIYHRKVYDKHQNLLLNRKSKWSLGKERLQIRFNSFYFNLDKDLSKYPSLVQDTLGGGLFNLERIGDKIGFCIGHYEYQNCYHKQIVSVE